MKRLWRWLRTPSTRWSLGGLIVVGGLGGIIFWGGFNTFMEFSNSYQFCTSCHEMSWVAAEYEKSHHHQNPSGVRAICSDCHVPKPWGAKLVRKIQASFNELPHKIMGTINTKEKFEAKRLELAKNVWASMKKTNSRECRNCHTATAMVLADQKQRARTQHEDARKTGETCIDCHKGIAHTKPKTEEDQKKGGEGNFQL